MTVRTASCRCGAVTARCEGEPVRISVCHCYACQQRTGSAFGAQLRFPKDRVTLGGETREWQRTSDEGNLIRYHFCPTCGSTVFYDGTYLPDAWAIALGAFADNTLPPPTFSVWEERRHPWVTLSGDIERVG